MDRGERIEKCPFFGGTLRSMPRMTDDIKERYCLGDSSRCARYIVAWELGPSNVPEDLFPFSMQAAEKILERVGKLPPY